MKAFTLILSLTLLACVFAAHSGESSSSESQSDESHSEEADLDDSLDEDSQSEESHEKREASYDETLTHLKDQLNLSDAQIAHFGLALKTLSRQRRATCDLLSIFNVNHTVCALGCVGKGFKGGYCSDKAVCTCRH